MCELLALSMRHPARVAVSLARLAARSALPGHLRDGWGFAAYQGDDVALLREPRAAADSPFAALLQTDGPVTRLALAHLRHATRGEVALANTQPFGREWDGRAWCFAHNGDLPGIERIAVQPGRRFRPIGDTDSEQAFCALLGRLADERDRSDRSDDQARQLAAVAAFAADLRALGPANFLFTDGRTLFAHAHKRVQAPGEPPAPPGLHMLQRHCTAPEPGFGQEDLCVAAEGQQAVVVASVPLSDEPWQALAEGEIAVIADGAVQQRLLT